MENQEGKEVIDAESKEIIPEIKETAEELKTRLDNAAAENKRKTQELQKLREELDSRSKPVESTFNPQDLTTWKDHELKAVLKDPQYVAMHDQATELLDRRRFQRFQAERDETTLRMNAELERQKEFPETFDPSHPLTVKMTEVMHQYRLSNNPAGRLVAARLASSELEKQKAAAAGRKAELERQKDIQVNFNGSARPAPKPSDKVKLEELKKKAMTGDKKAQAEWFKVRGLI